MLLFDFKQNIISNYAKHPKKLVLWYIPLFFTKIVIKILIFAYYKQSLKIIVKTDAFDDVSSRNFSYLEKDELLNIIMFLSKNLNPVEYNCEIYDKKLLAIIW